MELVREPKSEAVIGWIETSGERLAISKWSLGEFASAAAIKVRAGHAAANLVKQAIERVREFAQKHCAIAVPGGGEFHRAAELAGDQTLKLKAGGALNLAIAACLNAHVIFRLGAAMMESAKALGMNAVTV